MHILDRNAVAVPACLVAPEEGSRYRDLRGKEDIRARLLEMQQHRCAYCERRTGHDRDDGHIEHFRKQAEHTQLEVSWANMFWSCNDEKTCGKHKDKCDRESGPQARFDPNEIIDPSVNDPDDFFLFVTDGTIRHHEGLDAANERRALETLRVFQLTNSALLRKSREDAVNPYLGIIDTLLPAGKDVVIQYVESQLPKVESAPFSTAIRQYLEGFLP